MSIYNEYDARAEFEKEYENLLSQYRKEIYDELDKDYSFEVKKKNIDHTTFHDYKKYWDVFSKVYEPYEINEKEVKIWRDFNSIDINNKKLDLRSFIKLDSILSALLNEENLINSIDLIEEQFNKVICKSEYDDLLIQLNESALYSTLNVNYNSTYEDYLWKEIEVAKHFYDKVYESYIMSALNITQRFSDILDHVLEIYNSEEGSYIDSNIDKSFRYRAISDFGKDFEEEIREIANTRIETYKENFARYPHEIIWDFYKDNYKILESENEVIEGLRGYQLDLNIELDFQKSDNLYLGGNLQLGDAISHVSPIRVDGYEEKPNEHGWYDRKNVFRSESVKRLYIPNYVKDLIQHNYRVIIKESENIIRENKGHYKIRGQFKSENTVYKNLREIIGNKIRIIREKHIYSEGSKRLDFYLPDYNVAIEYNGIQHYKPVDFFGGLDGLKSVQNSDKLKQEYCSHHEIKLYIIKYDDDIRSKLNDIINEIQGSVI